MSPINDSDDPFLKELREAYEEDTNGWMDIRKEAKTDMRFVAGDPWDDNDKKQRKDRPTVAPEEMGQYFNQVINNLRSNPRGMKFSPSGNGASDEGARFYQNKAREIEYRSHAKIAYITAAENAIQRSYGFVRVNTRYASPRSANQELWIEDFPNPDMVLPDCNAKRPDSSDMQRCWVYQWMLQSDFKKQHSKAKVTSFGDWQARFPSWIQSNKLMLAEFWTIKTRKRKLLLVQPPAPMQMRSIAPQPTPAVPPVQLFDDEVLQMPGAQIIRHLRDVDYPDVWMYLTNGIEVLHEQRWLGKYIPIVSCYGKVIWVEADKGLERKMLSMTRFGRDPWKCYCYACCQELEVLGQTPKAPVQAIEGQMAGYEKDWQEAAHVPKAFLYYKALTAATGAQVLPPPSRIEYTASQHLQALEVVKEGFRRAIQSAMGSNFLPTQAQRRNEKSGVALDKMEKAAATGTFHFVDHYEDMIRQVAVIVEDLIDKIHDYQGETGVVEDDGTAKTVTINSPGVKDAVDTKGDYLVTVSTGPSSDSEREAAADFTDTLVGNIATVAQISGPKPAAAVLAQSIRMRNLGPMGDHLADIIEPAEYKKGNKQGPLPPEVQQALQEGEKMKAMLQQAVEQIKTDQVKAESQFKIESMKADKQTALQIALKRMDMAGKVEAARIAAAKQAADLQAEAVEESIALGHEADQATADRLHEVGLTAMEQQHEAELAAQTHEQALEVGAQQHASAADLQANQPEAGA